MAAPIPVLVPACTIAVMERTTPQLAQGAGATVGACTTGASAGCAAAGVAEGVSGCAGAAVDEVVCCGVHALSASTTAIAVHMGASFELSFMRFPLSSVISKNEVEGILPPVFAQ